MLLDLLILFLGINLIAHPLRGLMSITCAVFVVMMIGGIVFWGFGLQRRTSPLPFDTGHFRRSVDHIGDDDFLQPPALSSGGNRLYLAIELI